MRNLSVVAIIVSSLAFFGAHSTASGGTVRLDGIADGSTIYIEEQSDAFFRMDLFDPPPRETQQRFHAISDPSVTFGNLAFDGFPNDDDFRLGLVTFDDSALVGGTGVAPITDLLLGVGTDPTDPTHVNYGRWSPINTLVDSFSGTVAVANGIITSINLVADVRLQLNPIGSVFLDAPGTFSIAGDRFAGYMSVESTPGMEMIWDFSGTLTTVTVPEPSTWFLATMGLTAMALLRKRRTC